MDKLPSYHSRRYFFALIAMVSVPISGMTIDIYVPSLPSVRAYFEVNTSLVQLTISSYMLGFGLMQLFAGVISDSFGRKKPFIFSSIIYIAVSFLAPFTGTIYQLLVLRFIQGLMVAMLNVPMRAIISDLFEGIEFKRMMAYLSTAWAIGPIIAPAIGGYLEYYFGWHAAFYFLGLYGITMLLLNLLFMPETARYKHDFNVRQVLANYKEVLSNICFINSLLSLGLLYTMLILFSLIGPFLLQSKMHYTSIQFGHIALIMGVAWFLGNLTYRVLLEIENKSKLLFGFGIMLVSGISMLVLTSYYPLNIYVIVIPIFIILWLGGSIFPIYYINSMALFPHLAATANSLLGAFLVLTASIASAFGTLLRSTNAIPLSLCYIGIIVLCLMLYFINRFFFSVK